MLPQGHGKPNKNDAQIPSLQTVSHYCDMTLPGSNGDMCHVRQSINPRTLAAVSRPECATVRHLTPASSLGPRRKPHTCLCVHLLVFLPITPGMRVRLVLHGSACGNYVEQHPSPVPLCHSNAHPPKPAHASTPTHYTLQHRHATGARALCPDRLINKNASNHH